MLRLIALVGRGGDGEGRAGLVRERMVSVITSFSLQKQLNH